jgi:hypothetical protein
MAPVAVGGVAGAHRVGRKDVQRLLRKQLVERREAAGRGRGADERVIDHEQVVRRCKLGYGLVVERRERTEVPLDLGAVQHAPLSGRRDRWTTTAFVIPADAP